MALFIKASLLFSIPILSHLLQQQPISSHIARPLPDFTRQLGFKFTMTPSPRFFIVRPDTKRSTADGRVQSVPGAIVPLIAVDELPEWLDISDAPRELSVEQTIGLCNLGISSKGPGAYAVRIIHETRAAARQQSDMVKAHEVNVQNDAAVNASQASLGPSAATSSKTKALAPAPSPSAAVHATDRMKVNWSDSHTAANNTTNTGMESSAHNPQAGPLQTQPQPQPQLPKRPSAAQPGGPSNPTITGGTTASTTTTTTVAAAAAAATGGSGSDTTTAPAAARDAKAEYCRHWCHHGTCKWGLRCRYLHAMPSSPAELAAVGLREIPTWWVATVAGLPGRRHQRRAHHNHQHSNNNCGGSGSGGGGGGGSHAGVGAIAGDMAQGGDGTDGGRGWEFGFDPRDARVGVLRRLGSLPLGAGIPGVGVGGGGAGAGSGPGSGSSKRAKKAQLRETVALLRELWLGLGAGNGNGNGRARRKEREVNPFAKGRIGKGVDRESVQRVGKVDVVGGGAAVVGGTGAGVGNGSGPEQAVLRRMVQEKAAEDGRKQGGQTAGPGGQVMAAQQVGKLVDV